MNGFTKEEIEAIRRSGLFDAAWYLDTYPDVKALRMDPIEHYLWLGSKLNRNPSSKFDTAAYLDKNPDVAAEGANPLAHYVQTARAQGGRAVMPEQLVEDAPLPQNLLPISPNPLVSLIVVNYNGADHLNSLFRSLEKQTYTNFETIFIDNNSSDNSVEIAEASSLPIRVIKSNTNRGFSGGNNLGAKYARGEVFALLNNDTEVNEDWLSRLVECLHEDSNAAAATSKILFKNRFLQLSISALQYPIHFEFDRFLESLAYQKVFAISSHILKQDIEILPDASLNLAVPVQPTYLLVFRPGGFTQREISVNVCGKEASIVDFSTNSESTHIHVAIDSSIKSEAKWLINNAGSIELADGQPRDRGFAEFDQGQYETSECVPFFCGCSAAIKRGALGTDELFFEPFFAYYEDSELSARLRRKGYSVVYAPKSVVFHHHSATSIEYSGRWRTLTFRNKVFYDLLNNPRNKIDQIVEEATHRANHLRAYYQQDARQDSETEFAESVDNIIADIRLVATQLKTTTNILKRHYRRIGVYNTYWNTRGGGEVHALMIAKALEKYGEVDLISELPFDKGKLGDYFGIDTSAMNCRIIDELYDRISTEYEMFVNATFLSPYISKAELSFYLVSFPNRKAKKELLNSYRFLANSKFTRGWCKKWWGTDIDIEVLYPAVRQHFLTADCSKKDKTIINIGRFTPLGHSKKQIEMVQAFKTLQELFPDTKNWTLKLVGSVNCDLPEDLAYLDEVKARSRGMSVKVIANAPFATLSSELQTASIYWHLTGFGEDIEEHPELFEHFGMTVVEAASCRCWPIVLDAAGPKEIVETLNFGDTVSSLEDLVNRTASTINRFDAGNPPDNPKTLDQFFWSRQSRQLQNLVDDLLTEKVP